MTPGHECFERILTDRYSCRSFLSQAVPGQVTDRLFAMAQLAPSWCNTQPWQAHLLEGAVLEEFAEDLGAHVRGSDQVADLDMPAYEGVYASRRRESGFGLHAALGIDREDREARSAQAFKNFRFFGAPHSAIITTDRALGTYGAVDCGGYVQALLLGAQSLGLGALAQGAIAMYSDFVRHWLCLPDDRLVVCAVSFGYADQDAPVNSFRTTRAVLADVVRHAESPRRRAGGQRRLAEQG